MSQLGNSDLAGRSRQDAKATSPPRVGRNESSVAVYQSDKESQGAEGKETSDDSLDQEGCPAAQEKNMDKRPGKEKKRERVDKEQRNIGSCLPPNQSTGSSSAVLSTLTGNSSRV